MKQVNLEMNFLVGTRYIGNLEGCLEQIRYVKEIMLENSLCLLGPLILKTNAKAEKEFEILIPIGTEFDVSSNENIFYIDHLEISECVMERFVNLSEGVEGELNKCIEHMKNLEVSLEENYYIVLIDVYGEWVLDIYVPIKKG